MCDIMWQKSMKVGILSFLLLLQIDAKNNIHCRIFKSSVFLKTEIIKFHSVFPSSFRYRYK